MPAELDPALTGRVTLNQSAFAAWWAGLRRPQHPELLERATPAGMALSTLLTSLDWSSGRHALPPEPIEQVVALGLLLDCARYERILKIPDMVQVTVFPLGGEMFAFAVSQLEMSSASMLSRTFRTRQLVRGPFLYTGQITDPEVASAAATEFLRLAEQEVNTVLLDSAASAMFLVASSTSDPVLLTRLAESSDMAVRRAVAANPHTPAEAHTLAAIAHPDSPDGRLRDY